VHSKNLLSIVLNKDDQKNTQQRMKFLNNESEISVFGLNNGESFHESNIKQIVFQTNAFFESDDSLFIKKKILKHAVNLELVSDLKDEYFYLFHKNIFSVLTEEKVKKFNLMRGELIPFLINNSHHKKMQKYNPKNVCINENSKKESKKDEDKELNSHEIIQTEKEKQCKVCSI